MVIDLPSDKGLVHFHSISRILDLPEFVKQADFTEQVDINTLPAEAFADGMDRKFPIHTKAASFLSYAYFAQQKDGLDKMSSMRCSNGFHRAKNYWGLDEEFETIDKALTEKVAERSSKFAIVVGADKFFSINSPSEILKSASSLVDNRDKFDYALRSAGAKNIMKAAAECGLPFSTLPEAIHKMAGCGITTKEAAMMELTRRWDSEVRPSLAEPIHTCIEALSGLESGLIGGEVCEKIAEVIDRYDRSKGYTTFPEDILFAFTKQAADKIANSIVTMIDGTSYRLDQLEKAADAFNVLGDTIARDIRNMDGTLNLYKVAELIDTLPRTDASILKSALRIAGVDPFGIDKHAMVSLVVNRVQPTSLTTIHQKIEKRANILEKLEADDPLVKRALDVIRRLKSANEDGEDDDDDEKDTGEKACPPRGLKGLFIKKAPNNAETKPAK